MCVYIYIYRRGYRYLVWVSAAKISRLLGSKRFGWVKILANRRSFSSISCIREIYFRAKNDGPEVTAEGREEGKKENSTRYICMYGFPYICAAFRRGKSPSTNRFWLEFYFYDIFDPSRRSFSKDPGYIYFREENDEPEVKEGKKNSMRAMIDFYMVVHRASYCVFLEYFYT